jgi:type VI protein secretion system component VasF
VKRAVHETRSARARREFWKRLAIWVFIAFFALSVGGAMVVVTFIGR